MPHLKALFHFFDWIFYTFWGVTVINMINLFQDVGVTFEQVEGTVFQYVYTVMGFVYAAVMAYNKYKDGQVKREHEKLENKKLQEEIEGMEIDNEKKSEK